MTNQNNQNTKLLTEYLKEVQKKLPEWLKDNKEEVNNILAELEEHILDQACEISGTDIPDLDSLQQAIEKMGSPEKVTSGYKQRGTPKYFITEELWSIYAKTLIFVNVMLFVIITTVLIIFSSPDDLVEMLIQNSGGLYAQVTSVSLFITAIYVYLSKEGYLLENICDEKKKTDEFDETSLKSKSTFYNPQDLLRDAFSSGFFGCLFVIQRFFTFTNVTTTEMQTWLFLLGVIILFDSFLKLLKLRNNITVHQILEIIYLITNIPVIGLLVILASNPGMVFSVSIHIPTTFVPYICYLFILVIIMDGFYTIYKIYQKQKQKQHELAGEIESLKKPIRL